MNRALILDSIIDEGENTLFSSDSEEQKQAFLTAMSILEKNEEEYMTVSELQNIMLEEGVQPYASTWIISRDDSNEDCNTDEYFI